MKRRKQLNRRAFLYGAGSVAIGLPFLEGLPERSAWAADATPIFTFFICGSCGVEPKRFWPASTGALSLTAGGPKAVDQLADQAKNLLIVRGINYPLTGPTGCGHAQGLCQAFTAKTPTGNGSQATATGPSADVIISKAVNKAGTDPITLYAGNLRNGYIADRLSFDESGRVRASVDNPYKLYQKLTGLAAPAGSGGGTTPPPTTGGPSSMAEELVQKRKSVNDLVRAELNSLLANPKLSAADRQRLQQHFDAIRDVENTMMGMGQQMATVGCTLDGINTSTYEALSSWKYNPSNVPNGGIENIVELHLGLVALAFACDYSRTGTLQWGDGTDQTVYRVPSNDREWKFHYISHRAQSDSNVGDDPLAAKAHAEIDVVRMQTLAAGLDHFQARGLADKSLVLWTNGFADGPSHATHDVPHIVWGNGGGHLKQGVFIDVGGVSNNQLLNTLISAAIQDTGTIVDDFGSGTPGLLDAIRA